MLFLDTCGSRNAHTLTHTNTTQSSCVCRSKQQFLELLPSAAVSPPRAKPPTFYHLLVLSLPRPGAGGGSRPAAGSTRPWSPLPAAGVNLRRLSVCVEAPPQCPGCCAGPELSACPPTSATSTPAPLGTGMDEGGYGKTHSHSPDVKAPFICAQVTIIYSTVIHLNIYMYIYMYK